MLKLERKTFYRIKEGQTLQSVSRVYGVSARALAKANGLQAEPCVGQILYIPLELCGNAYTANVGDTPTLLCGSKASFQEKNGGETLYPGMRVIL